MLSIATLQYFQNDTIFTLLLVMAIHNCPLVFLLQHDTDKQWDIVSSLVKGDIPSLYPLDIATDAIDAWAELTNPDRTTDPQDPLVRFIQDVLCHWMYATAAKKILQILTPEALILWRR